MFRSIPNTPFNPFGLGGKTVAHTTPAILWTGAELHRSQVAPQTAIAAPQEVTTGRRSTSPGKR